ncbi:MAG: LiaF-related protein [Phycisphaerales bacterium]|nr:LiaF-related protein [Phycisphaerales bacterium]
MTTISPQKNQNNASIFFGVFIATAGVLFLLKQFKIIEFNFEIWPLFLIAGGVISGIKRGFYRIGPLAMIIIGIAFVIPEFPVMGVSSDKLFWPILLIIGGVFIALRAKKKDSYFTDTRANFAKRFEVEGDVASTSRNENFVNIEAFFGGRKEMITSKQFNGCNATAICGGAEINLMQADSSNQPMIIDLKIIFGGIEIIVPSHWEIVNEVDVLFGSIEDKRNLRMASDLGDSKKLLLRGSVSFGGLELKSY